MKLPNFTDDNIKDQLIQPIVPYYVIYAVEQELPKILSETSHKVNSRKVIDPTVNLTNNSISASFNYIFKISNEEKKQGKRYKKGCLIPELDLVPYYEGRQSNLEEQFEKIKRNLKVIQNITFNTATKIVNDSLSFVKVLNDQKNKVTDLHSKTYRTKKGYEYRASCENKGSADSEKFNYDYMFYIKTENADANISILGNFDLKFPSTEEFYEMFQVENEEDEEKVNSIIKEFLTFYSKNILPTSKTRIGKSMNYESDIKRIMNTFKRISKAAMKKKKVESNLIITPNENILTDLIELEDLSFTYVTETIDIINGVENYIKKTENSFKEFFEDFYGNVSVKDKSTTQITFVPPVTEGDTGTLSFTQEFTVRTDGENKESQLYPSIDSIIQYMIQRHNLNNDTTINYGNPYYGYLDVSELNKHTDLYYTTTPFSYYWIRSDNPKKIDIKLNINIGINLYLSDIIKQFINVNFPYYENYVNIYRNIETMEDITKGYKVRPLQKGSLIELLLSSLYQVFSKIENLIDAPAMFKENYISNDIFSKMELPIVVQLLKP